MRVRFHSGDPERLGAGKRLKRTSLTTFNGTLSLTDAGVMASFQHAANPRGVFCFITEATLVNWL